MKADKYLFLPSFSLIPNKLTLFNSVFLRNPETQELKPIQSLGKNRVKKNVEIRESNSITRKHHNFTISNNAFRTLKSKISWLYYLAKSKQVKTYNGKHIFNFKIGFITLTLPSKQKHPTSYITKELLNHFLTEVRQRTKMENYVWRLEFQKNGNVHYHLVTDTYLDYHFILRIWNKILSNHGYIDDYRTKMEKLSLTQYIELAKKSKNYDYAETVKRYARNKRENWSNPNSVDVKSVVSNKAISNYIAKYFAKDSKENPIKNELDTDENSENMRLWFCSRSLSRLKTVSNFVEAVEYDIEAILSYCSDKKVVIGKYAKSIYFDFKNFTSHARRWVEMILRSYAAAMEYAPSF